MFSFVCLATLALSNALHVFTARETLHPGESMYLLSAFATLCLVFLATHASWHELLQYGVAVYGIYVFRWVMERFIGVRVGDPRKLR